MWAQIGRLIVEKQIASRERPHVTLNFAAWHDAKAAALQQVSKFVADREVGNRFSPSNVQPDDHVLGFRGTLGTLGETDFDLCIGELWKFSEALIQTFLELVCHYRPKWRRVLNRHFV